MISIYTRYNLWKELLDREHVVFELSCDGEGYCEFAITEDCSDARYTKYYLRGKSIMYGRNFDIEKKEVKFATARKIIDMVYPLDKWNVSNIKRSLAVDGTHLSLHLNDYCEVYLSGNRFNIQAVYEVVDALIWECIKTETDVKERIQRRVEMLMMLRQDEETKPMIKDIVENMDNISDKNRKILKDLLLSKTEVKEEEIYNLME